MYERLLDKNNQPTAEGMTEYCCENAERFATLNGWIDTEFGSESTVVLPYGNKYGWGEDRRN